MTGHWHWRTLLLVTSGVLGHADSEGDACTELEDTELREIDDLRVELLQRSPPALTRTSAVQLEGASTAKNTDNETSSSEERCTAKTNKFCMFKSMCKTLGASTCTMMKCQCLPGYCYSGARCQQQTQTSGRRQCDADTQGSCFLMGCGASRGPTTCMMGKCMCQPGYCSDNGVCKKDLGSFEANVVQLYGSQRFPGHQAEISSGSALCISGGGSRALSVALGAFRALENLGMMKNVSALSSVSGGSWASAIYMFADLPESILLGTPTTPAELTLEILGRKPPALGATAQSPTIKIASELFGKVPLDELWTRTIGEAFLSRFKLDDMEAFMAQDEADVKRIQQANPQLKGQRFLTPMPGRPRSFVMSGVILGPEGFSSGGDSTVALQMSPDYSGSPFYPNNQSVEYVHGGERLREEVGGGLMETFAFGSDSPPGWKTAGTVKVQAPLKHMSLARAIGISSAAFAGGVSKLAAGLDVSPKNEVWPVLSPVEGFPQQASRHQFGDGYILDNLGVLAMLQRRASRIATFVGTDRPLSKSIDFCTAPLPPSLEGQVSSDLASLFGFGKDSVGSFTRNNQVFKAEDFKAILCELQGLVKAGKPAVALKSLTLQSNRWWGIEGGAQVDILIYYNEVCADFEASLPEATQAEIAKGRNGGQTGEFVRYPFVKTTFQHFGKFTYLSEFEVNLLSAQVEYAIRQNEQLFRRIF
mmetsp:Transcript_24407/g.44221  ORF Transcript_24407/g.44221 Transcript_24407/m.44221 type:complete len:704 (+) Transcript_24407:58-2169(+)